MGKQGSIYLKSILTPATEQSLFGQQLVEPLLRGENITVLSLPHAGIKEKMTYFVNKIGKFGRNLGKTIFVYLDPNDLSEDSPEGYFKMMATLIDNQEIAGQNSLLVLKEKINTYLNQGYRLVFILGYFYKLNYPVSFFNNLFGLYQINRQKINFIFTSSQNIFLEENLSCFGELRELLVQNIVYFPVLSDEDSLFVVKNLSLRYGYSLSQDKEKLAVRLAGGHPTLILFCLRIFNNCHDLTAREALNYLGQRPEIKIILENIWTSFAPDEKNLLLQIVNEKKIMTGANLNNLQNLKIIDPVTFSLFSSLLTDFIKRKNTSQVPVDVLGEDRQILIGGQPPKDKINGREYKLLAAFSKIPGRIISRDEIADILWGKLSYDKYSDWAIDRAIFSLRKKMERFGVSPDVLQTVKGLGYRLIA